MEGSDALGNLVVGDRALEQALRRAADVGAHAFADAWRKSAYQPPDEPNDDSGRTRPKG